MKIVSTTQMRAIEKESDKTGTSYAQLMQNAGHAIAEFIVSLGQENNDNTITALVGSGNNGGDALVTLTQLAQNGWQTHAYLVNRTPDTLITKYLEAGGELEQFTSDVNFETLRTFLAESNFLLDGLLGTGIKLPLRREAALILQSTSLLLSTLPNPPLIIAIDCPSGIDCDTGTCAEETLHADITLAMAAIKRGMLKLPAFEKLGELHTLEIGLPQGLESWEAIKTNIADAATVAACLPERSPASHKGTFGTAFVVAGCLSYTGAALLAGRAAYRIGVGLVALGIAEPLHTALAGHLPEAVWACLPHEQGYISEKAVSFVLPYFERATAVLIGPGMGNKQTTKYFIEQILPQCDLPTVFDADGLRHLVSIQKWYEKLKPCAVLTPHPAEMAALTGLSVAQIQAERENLASQFAKEWGHVVVLKGAFTVIASPVGQVTIIPVATAALARAGTGDVLAGLIVGLLAQGLAPYQAAVAGAYIHAQAGVLAGRYFGNASVLASDVLEAVPDVLSKLE